MKACGPEPFNAINAMTQPSPLSPSDTFVRRHIGPSDDDITSMIETVGVSSLDELIDQTLPADIRLKRELDLGRERGEQGLLDELRGIAVRTRS